MFKTIFFMVSSMAISLIASEIYYYKQNHAIVRFEGLYLTGEQFMIGAAVAGLVLSFF